ncbi:MAG: FAD-binding protein, partial [Anaeroplasmataceae bacterium]|nr:FAD-binding protein [Anaeroplasmataceae bacterium]
MTFEQYVLDHNLGIIEKNYSFKELTTIGCGGEIKTLYTPNSISSLQQAFIYIQENELKYFLIGNGSNVLAKDEEYDGIVIHLRKIPHTYTIKDNILECSAFYPTIKLAYDLAKEEWGDLSFLGGIPGLLGGAIYNNSGAYKDDISHHLIDVTYIN